MNTHAEKSQEDRKQTVSHSIVKSRNGGGTAFQIVDNRPEAVTQRKLQEVVNNSPQVLKLKAFKNMTDVDFTQNQHTIQRWPEIQTGSGNFQYELGSIFKERHIANSKQKAIIKARALYDPNHKEGSHSAYVTVIYGDIEAVTQGADAVHSRPYHWALSINVDAVCMGPRGIRGASGDPGQMDENISTVVLSGYGEGTADKPAKITHVSTSI